MKITAPVESVNDARATALEIDATFGGEVRIVSLTSFLASTF
jgi:hypothetical protein